MTHIVSYVTCALVKPSARCSGPGSGSDHCNRADSWPTRCRPCASMSASRAGRSATWRAITSAARTSATVRPHREARGNPNHRKRPKTGLYGPQGRSGHDSTTSPRPMRWARSGATIVASLPITRGMEPHFHAWLRSGRIFTMAMRPFADRTTAHRWATKQRPNKADRLVLGCTECPPTRPSKHRPPRWATVARQVAAAVGAEPAAVRRALATALAAERER